MILLIANLFTKRLYTNHCNVYSITILSDNSRRNAQFYFFFCIILKVLRLLMI